MEGVRLEIDKRVKPVLPSLKILTKTTDGQSPVTRSEWDRHLQINGQDLRILEGELKIGARSYGAVSSETAIEIIPEGVLVD